MKRILSGSLIFTVSIMVITIFVVYGISEAAENSSVKQETAKSSAPATGSVAAKELTESYILRLLYANTETPVETITFKKDETGTISATMVCEKYGKQDIPVVYFDGKVLKFIALAGSNHDEHFFFELKFYGAFLIGEAEGGRGPIPVIAKDAKDKIYW